MRPQETSIRGRCLRRALDRLEPDDPRQTAGDGDGRPADFETHSPPPRARAAAQSRLRTQAVPRRVAGARPAPLARSRGEVEWSEIAATLLGARRAGLIWPPAPAQQAVLGRAMPTGPRWLHEILWKGQRLSALIVDGEARLWAENGEERSDAYPGIVLTLQQLGLQQAHLDGVLIADPGLRERYRTAAPTAGLERRPAATLILFDLLHVDGVDIEQSPLVDRKTVLELMLRQAPRGLEYGTHILGSGKAALALALSQHLEGVICKRAFGRHVQGPSPDWRRIGLLQFGQFAIVGYTPADPAARRPATLLLGRPKGQTGWRYVGRVAVEAGSEFERELLPRLVAAARRRVTFGPDVDPIEDAVWCNPRLVVEVRSHGFNSKGLLRQPGLQAWRRERKVAELRLPASTRRRSSRRG